MNVSLAILFFILSSTLFAVGHIEYCVGSQLKYKHGGSGGTGGHAFLYVEGLCKDYRLGFPRVIPCAQVSAELLAQYPHSGVGISLDSEFKNINWVAIPTRDLTFNGGSIHQILDKALQYKVFEGVELHDSQSRLGNYPFSEILKQRGVRHITNNGTGKIHLNQKLLQSMTNSYETFTSLYATGTDIGIANARDLACIKLELKNQNQLREIAGFLNRTNGQYQTQGKSFVWHMLLSNCTHLALNTVSTAGFDTHFYQIDPFVRSPKISEYLKDLVEDAKTAIKNMQTPADGFKKLAKQFPDAPIRYIPASKQLDHIFDTNKLKVFSFKPLVCNEYFNKNLSNMRANSPKWFNRNIFYNNSFFKKYSQHFYSIKTLTKQ